MSWHQDGWSYSAERAWYEPPEYDTPTPPENDISVKQLIKIMNERIDNSPRLKPGDSRLNDHCLQEQV